MASSEGDQVLAGAFHAIIDKIEADILANCKEVQLGNELSYIKNTFSERLLL